MSDKKRRFAVGARVRVKMPGVNGIVTQLDDEPTALGEYWHSIQTERGERREPGCNLELVPRPVTNLQAEATNLTQRHGNDLGINVTTTDMFEYDVAISFAGEQRAEAEAIAGCLRDAGINVFYDRYEQANLWGKDLYEHLSDIYHKKARYCLMLVSADYAAKVWPTHERRSAQARALGQKGEYILPVRFDETEIPGLPSTVGYLWFSERGAEGICTLLRQKLNSPYELSQVRAVTGRAVAPPSGELTSADPRVYVEVESGGLGAFSRTYFVLTNHGADVAHRVRIEPLVLRKGRACFDPTETTLPPKEPKKFLSEIADQGVFSRYDIASLLLKEWDFSGKPTAEFSSPMTVLYEDFRGTQFETRFDLVCFTMHAIARKNRPWSQQDATRRILEIRNPKPKRL